MIYNEELYKIDDQIQSVVSAVLDSKLISEYISASNLLKTDQTVSLLMSDFLAKKAVFENIEMYGKYAPNFKVLRRELRQSKRKLDTNEVVSRFKYTETSLQDMLDYMCFDIAQTTSSTIKIDAGNPFFEFATKGCGGTCHDR